MDKHDLCLHCDAPLIQSGRGRRKQFCDNQCGQTYRNRLKGHIEKELHTLSQINDIERTATCSTCGPGVRIWKGGLKRERFRCASRVRAQQSRARTRDPLLERVRKLVGRGVKITVEEYTVLVDTAAGVCQLCGRETGILCLDHDHETGHPRGLLCSICNTGLGKFGDDPDQLRAAADYLDAARAKETAA